MWQILQQPLQVNVKNAGKAFLCCVHCARLHNFVIDNERVQGEHQQGIGSIAGINSTVGDDDDQQGDDNATISIFFHLT
jgi:hypothetical protein